MSRPITARFDPQALAAQSDAPGPHELFNLCYDYTNRWWYLQALYNSDYVSGYCFGDNQLCSSSDGVGAHETFQLYCPDQDVYYGEARQFDYNGLFADTATGVYNQLFATQPGNNLDEYLNAYFGNDPSCSA
jgi:hypothetical protein